MGESKGHRRYWIFVLMFLLATINYVDRVVLSVSSAPIAQEFGIDKVQLGYLFSSFLWLYVVCLVPMGIIVDKLGTRTVNAAGIGLWSIATALTGLASGFGMLIATRVLMGVGESTTYPASGRVIREWIPLKELRCLRPSSTAAPISARRSVVLFWQGWSAHSAGARRF
jgi:MFS family permease